jgi:hypothetical protein
MFYTQILLVKASWESEAEDKARYILYDKINCKISMGIYLLSDGEVLSKEQVKEDIVEQIKNEERYSKEYRQELENDWGYKFRSYEELKEEKKHLGIFRANLDEAQRLIEMYGHHIMNEEHFFTFVYDDGLHEIYDRNDPRLTSREYFVVPFRIHR